MSTKPDYTRLDAAILAAIQTAQPAIFSAFAYSGAVKRHSQELDHTEKNGESWRVVDRRLQALRKAGQIRYQRKPEGWVINSNPKAQRA